MGASRRQRTSQHEKCEKTKPKHWKYPLIENRPLRRNALHTPLASKCTMAAPASSTMVLLVLSAIQQRDPSPMHTPFPAASSSHSGSEQTSCALLVRLTTYAPDRDLGGSLLCLCEVVGHL